MSAFPNTPMRSMKLRTSIQTLIALHIGAISIVACTPTQQVGADPAATAMPSSRVAPLASTQPSTPPTTQPSSPPPPPTLRPIEPPKRTACKTNADCAEHYYCSEGECKVQSLGRPLTVDGAQHVASTRTGRGWHAEHEATSAQTREAIARAALEEHASIAAFARTICELLSLGAPAWLIEETQRALADEIDHARRTFALLGNVAGAGTEPGLMPAATAPFAGPAALVRDVLWGGCIGETEAAHRASAQADAASTDEERALYRRIAEDEARHAALAFKTVRWLVSARPELREVLDAELAIHDRAPSRDVGDLIDVLRG